MLNVVVQHNLGIGKDHKIKGRKPERLYISCSRGDQCVFRVNAVLVDGLGLHITKFQEHLCEGGSGNSESKFFKFQYPPVCC